MTTYTVNMALVSTIAEEMGATAGVIRSMLEELDSSSRLSLANWTSDARDSYNHAKAVWDQKAADMAVQAAKAQNALGEINGTYRNAEVQGVNLWGR